LDELAAGDPALAREPDGGRARRAAVAAAGAGVGLRGRGRGYAGLDGRGDAERLDRGLAPAAPAAAEAAGAGAAAPAADGVEEARGHAQEAEAEDGGGEGGELDDEAADGLDDAVEEPLDAARVERVRDLLHPLHLEVEPGDGD